MSTLLDSAELWLRPMVLLSWKGTLLTVVAGVSLLLLRRHLSPAWRHGLWLLVVLRFVLPDLGTSSFSMNGSVADVPDVAREVVAFEAERVEMPPLLIEEAVPAAVSSLPPPVFSEPEVLSWNLDQVLTVIWLVGAALTLCVMVLLHARLLSRIWRDASPPSPEVASLLQEACRLARIRRMPRLIVTDAIRAPSLFGIFRPAILLPKALAVNENPAGLKLIFLHELAHLKRWDLCSQIIASLAVALHWFNPVVWWAGRRLRAEAEMAADAHALRSTGAAEAHRMGELLLGFAHHAAAAWILSFLAVTQLGISDNKRDLRRRIEALMDIARGRRTLWFVGLGLFFVLALTGLTQAPAQEAGKTTTPAPTTAPDSTGKTTVAGRVVDPQGKPVANATCMLRVGDEVDFEQRKAMSDANGRFQFESVPHSSQLRAWARHADFLDSKLPAPDITPQEREDLKIVLQPITSWISGAVKNKADGQPIKGATVFLAVGTLAKLPTLTWLSIASAQAGQTVTDDAGHYRLPRKTEDTNCVLVVQAPGMKMTKNKFEWRENMMNMDHALEADPGISGKVVTAEGAPAQGASLSVGGDHFVAIGSLTKAKTSDTHYSSGRGHWLGDPVTGSNGEFLGRTFQEEAADEPWIIAQHPEHGIQYTPLKDWKNGGTIQLEKWKAMQGTLLDAEGNLQKGKEIKLIQSEDSRDMFQAPRSRFSISNHVTGFTDDQGRYKFEHLLPHFTSSSALVDGQYIRLPAGGWIPGKTLELTLRMQPKADPMPTGQARHIRGRVRLPADKGVKLPEHEIWVNISPEGALENPRMTELDGEGHFTTSMLPPGRYKLRIQVEPKDRSLMAPPNGGLSMIFTVEAAADKKLQDLGEFKLTADDFAFIPRSASTSSSKTSSTQRRDQKVDAAAEDAPLFVSWAGSGGSGVGPEFKFTPDGRMVGTVAASNNERFMLRATKTDGTRFFTAAQITTPDAKDTFKDELAFRPGVIVEGQIRDLPGDYAGDGWVVALVRVSADAAPDTVQKGAIPVLHWYAWAPVRKDGSFRFPSLPRGSLEVAGWGEGWVTRNLMGYTADVMVNLLAAGPVLKMTADCQPSLSSRVRVLRPDGTPAAGASVSVVSVTGMNLSRAFNRWGYDKPDADAEAYARFKQERIPGHDAVADADGYVSLRNLPHKDVTCEVKWTDPRTKAEQVEKVQAQVSGRDPKIHLAGTQL